jgi:hypothetical protein
MALETEKRMGRNMLRKTILFRSFLLFQSDRPKWSRQCDQMAPVPESIVLPANEVAPSRVTENSGFIRVLSQFSFRSIFR